MTVGIGRLLTCIAVAWVGLAPAWSAGFFEGPPVEEWFEGEARPHIRIKGEFFSLDIIGHDGPLVAGRAEMSSRLQARNEVHIRLIAADGELLVDVISNGQPVLPSALRERPTIYMRVPNGSSVSVIAAGSIVLEHLSAPAVDLYTFSGDILVRSVDAELSTTTATGTTWVQNSSGTKRLLTSDGDIFVRDSPGGIRLQTVTGSAEARNITGDIVSNIGPPELALYDVDGQIVLEQAPVTGLIGAP